MAVQVVTVDNLGNDFDLGGAEAGKLHVHIDGVTIQRTASGVLSANAGSSKAYLLAIRAAAQTTGLAVGGRIVFDTVAAVVGSKITLNPATGVFTVQPGSYEVVACATYVQGASAQLLYHWRNETTSPSSARGVASSPSSAARRWAPSPKG